MATLTIFVQAPIEILTRIFSHAHPSDLISLSRTNKWLRFLLSCRSDIWRKAVDALKHFPLPPVGVDYWRWLELLFSKTCQKCGAVCEEPDFQLHVRLCDDCGKTYIIGFARLGCYTSGRDLILTSLCNRGVTSLDNRWTHLFDQGRNYQFYYFLEDYNTAARLLESVEKELYVTHEEQPTDTQIYLHQRIKPVLARQSRLRSEAYRHLDKVARFVEIERESDSQSRQGTQGTREH